MDNERLRRHWPESPAEHRVAVLGASHKPHRYSHMALKLLGEQGYASIPVHPKIRHIDGQPVTPSLRAVHEVVHTLTLYVCAELSLPMLRDITHLNPWRVIFNPGSESRELEQALNHHHIQTIHGCTLVMLKTGQF